MPHIRKRHIHNLIKKTLTYSPITGVFGHRQVGKTTLTSLFADKYTTLDNIDDNALASSSPADFLLKYSGKPLVIDECQLAPPLFPAMKEWVRTRKMPGQLLLTGSVRFSSRKAIRESLTGRIINWELLPMDIAEQAQEPLANSLINFLKLDSFDNKVFPHAKYFSNKVFEKYLTQGGLPSIFSIREDAMRTQKFETQINTMLERDLRLLTETTLPYRSLRNLFSILSNQIAAPFELSELVKKTRITSPTLKKLLNAMESMFLIRFLPTEGDYSKPILFFEDIGEANFLNDFENKEKVLLTSFLYQNLRTQFHYRPELKIESFNFRLKNGDVVDLCYRFNDKHLGILPFTKKDQLKDLIKSMIKVTH